MNNRISGPLGWLLFPVTGAMMMFILAPLLVTIAISIGDTAYVVFPPRGFTLSWYAKVLQDEDFQASLSFGTGFAVAATFGALLLGVPAAFAVTRNEFPGRAAATAALLSPLIFPVLITGVALLQLSPP
jgi:putative spermidine/putrescine transport system permease protein